MTSDYPYDDRYDPPLRAVEVALRHPDGDRATWQSTGLLDTGADGTLVPSEVLWHISSPAVAEAQIRSHWGEPRVVQLFAADLEIGGDWFPSVLVVGDDDGDDIVLGRNVLRKLKLVLDGVKGITQLSVR